MAVPDISQVGLVQTRAVNPADSARGQLPASLVTPEESVLPPQEVIGPSDMVSMPSVDSELAHDVDLGLMGGSVFLPSDQPRDSVGAVRRTRQATAGQHSNVHHLP